MSALLGLWAGLAIMWLLCAEDDVSPPMRVFNAVACPLYLSVAAIAWTICFVADRFFLVFLFSAPVILMGILIGGLIW